MKVPRELSRMLARSQSWEARRETRKAWSIVVRTRLKAGEEDLQQGKDLVLQGRMRNTSFLIS